MLILSSAAAYYLKFHSSEMSASGKQMRIILRHPQENTASIWSRRILEKQEQKQKYKY